MGIPAPGHDYSIDFSSNLKKKTSAKLMLTKAENKNGSSV